MLTITYKNRKLYINVSLLKEYIKIAFLRLLTILTVVFAIAGSIVILGTAGASDLNTIPFNQIVIQSFYGLFLCGIAYILNFIKLVIE